MASVNSKFRNLIKPILFRILGESSYSYFLKLGKIQDIRKRLVEEPEMGLLPLIVSPGSVCLDIGANYAYYSHRISQLVGPTGTVYSFEPIASTYEVASYVLAWFKCENVRLYNLGVSHRDAEVEFSIPETKFGVVSAGLAHIGTRINQFDEESGYQFDRHRKVMAKVVRLDNFLLPQLERLDFVKIDIEGAEMWAFEGMKRMLQKFKPIVLCEYSPRLLEGFNVDPHLWEKSLRDEYDYDIFMYSPISQQLTSVARGALKGSNYIFIPKCKRDQFRDLIVG